MPRFRYAEPVPLLDRFWAKVEQGDDHWLWTGARNGTGHGVIAAATDTPGGPRRVLQARRIAYEAHYGPLPDGYRVGFADGCDEPLCVRWEHLEGVSRAEASRSRRERAATGAGTTKRGTHCGRGHALTPENVEVIDGRRWCRTCRAARLARAKPPPPPKPPRTKLTAAHVATIREQYAAGQVQGALAQRFGVSKAVIGRIVRRETWRLLPGDDAPAPDALGSLTVPRRSDAGDRGTPPPGG